MIQEYLLLNSTDKEAVKAYKPNGITAQFFSVEDGKCWYVRFSIEGKNEECARKLSELDEEFRQKFHVTVLESGCSAYFNKRLYQLISKFEYKLRKLLYVVSALNYDDKTTKNIADLESKDFGQIFSLLFIDDKFMGKVKNDIKQRNLGDFSKKDVLALIESTEENSLWDSLLGKDTVPTLRTHFNSVRSFRNDVMHSHNINWTRFREAHKLYTIINNELDKALLEVEGTESKNLNISTFNQTLEKAIQAQKELQALPFEVAELLKKIETIKNISIPEEILKEIAKKTKIYEENPGILAMCEKIQEVTKNLSIPEIKIPPEILKLQNNLPSFSAPSRQSGKRQQGGADNSSKKRRRKING